MNVRQESFASRLKVSLPLGLLVGVMTLAPPDGAGMNGLILVVGSTNGPPDTEVLIPVRGSGFTNLSTVQFSLQWVSAVATYVGVESFGVPGLGAGNFGTSQASDGTLTVSWDDPDGSCKSLPEGATVFAVRLRLTGSPGATSDVAITGKPTTIEASDCDLEAVPAVAVTGVIIVDIPPPVIADFTGEPTNGVAPLSVSFTNLSRGNASCTWDFGDGQSTTNDNPANTYFNAGSYSVTLTVLGPGGTNVVVRTNYILVLNPALLMVTPAGLDFGLLTIGATAQASFVISNTGSATLTGAAAVDPGPFTLLSGTPYRLEESGATNLTVSFNPVAAGVFSKLVVFTSLGGNATYTVTGRATDAPRLVVLPADGTDFIFAFDTVPGLTYLVQFKDALDDLNWQPAQSVPGDGTRKTVTQNSSELAQRFYRLWVQ